ncbi:cyclopropane-fatty-acyl-phospholipid synthase family protein [Jannaschia sp. W003]|uniref:SAM-dependent methyltransferase n=1 Tax=Jannaschia sp. W003 TaxID=2867012 RepID=UPI0021A43AB6|nr:cyclopropane-fatty-acyl-phospholipid synthase family protein [Jannaschia sp. W003]UWQ21347.1 cyclopropane-fatty-acyl-phospholipid synthase family protein [Jannaschia sp. W003]
MGTAQGMVRRLLRRVVRLGRLEVAYPDGLVEGYGSGEGAPHVAARLHTDRAVRAILLDPELALGEAWMDGTLTLNRGTLHDFFTLLARNGGRHNAGPLVGAGYKLRYAVRRWAQANGVGRARANVAHHYDLGDDFYALWLDEDHQYSCAYFPREGMTLEEAQEAKKAHIAAKLVLRPGMRVLDIGCGWGGMALTLAREHGVHVTGITLSENQAAAARARAEAAGLADRIDIRLTDYRDLHECFDRVVSVGMLEHVGAPNYGTYFAKVADLMDEDGVALIHTIGRCGPPTTTSSWLAKYIFPGGYNPSLSELAAAFERTGLWQADVEVWRGHYAETLRRWRARFERNVDEVRAMYDERFVQMWRYYLTGAEVGFDDLHHVVYQIQLAKRRATVPETRDYLYR